MRFHLVVNNMASRYTDYYLRQIGRGDVGPVYRGSRVMQRGRGGFFANILRSLRPLFRSGLSAVKDQAIESTSAIARDIGKKPFREILKEQGKMAATNLAKRGIKRMSSSLGAQTGSGIKRRKKKSVGQSVKKIRQVGGKKKKKTATKKKKTSAKGKKSAKKKKN